MSNFKLKASENDFVLVGVNSISAKFISSKPNPNLEFVRANKNPLEAFNFFLNKQYTSESIELLFAPMLNQIFPGFNTKGMLTNADNSFKIISQRALKELEPVKVKNINPVDAINPSKSFLPVTPFYSPQKSSTLLWDRVRSERITKNQVSKKQNSSLIKLK